VKLALVTGASGFLGGRLAAMLVERGVPLRLLVRESSRVDHLSLLPAEVVRTELTDADSLRPAISGVSHIFHCAGCSTDWASASAYFSANVQATRALLLAARYAGTVERFVHVSTTDVYGYPKTVCDETHPLTYVGLPYNETKCLGETAVWEAYEKAGLPVTVIRPATIYGPRGTAFVADIVGLLRDGSMALFDGGNSRGGFSYVDNVADAMIASATHAAAVGKAYNIADGTNVTWAEYVAALADGLGLKRPWIDLPAALARPLGHALEIAYRLLPLPGRPLLTRHAVLLLARDQEFPTVRAVRDFGFSPHVSFTEGIKRTLAWVRGSGRNVT